MTTASASEDWEDWAVPWRSRREWSEAVRALDRLVLSRDGGLAEALSRAAAVRDALEELFPLLDALCLQTCVRCPDPCCLHAAVYVDFRDLLFLSLSEIDRPPGQLRRHPGETCRFFTDHGCRLPRLQRPWVCTWYLCAAQRSRVAEWTASNRHRLLDGLDRIRAERKRMEESFLLAVT